ncbi:glycosyltransferase family 2 protein [bacterium]|nr:glycosyltransferase family 2 protein [bacterium]
MLDLSIVLPVKDESESLELLHDEIMESLAKRPKLSFEIIYVDDGSSDDSIEKLKLIASKTPEVIVAQFSRSYGQTAAMYAGFQLSVGKVVVALDSDGQNDPADIFRLVDELEQGYDCVSGWRVNRQEKSLARRLPSAMANRLIARASGVRIHDSGCTLKAYSGDLLREIPLYGDMHRLIPFYVHLAGGTVTELPVNHRVRYAGASKYGLTRTFRVIQDILVAKVQSDFARRPMHLFGSLALGVGLVGLCLTGLALLLKLIGLRDLVETPLLVIAAMTLLAALQLGLVGLLGEILLRRLTLGQSDNPYRIRRKIQSRDLVPAKEDRGE